MRGRALLVLTGLLVFAPLLASSQESLDGGGFDRPEVWRYLGPSLAVPAAADALRFVGVFAPDTRPILPWITNPTLILAHLPLYWLDTGTALAYTAAGLGLPALAFGLPALAPESPLLRDASGALLGAYTNTMRFSVYEVYRQARGRVPPGQGYGRLTPGPPFRSHGLWELLSAGFRPDTILHPLVYVPALVGTAAFGAFYLTVVDGDEGAVWRTGEAYIGDIPVHPALGLMYSSAYNVLNMAFVAAGEEALYRGVVYEEIRAAAGPRTAKLVDVVLFPLIHLPGDLGAGLPAEAVLFNTAYRAAMTLVFDFAYDAGGLFLSTAAHFWSDVLLLTLRWLAYGGVQGPAGPSAAAGIPPSAPAPEGITMSFSIPL